MNVSSAYLRSNLEQASVGARFIWPLKMISSQNRSVLALEVSAGSKVKSITGLLAELNSADNRLKQNGQKAQILYPKS